MDTANKIKVVEDRSMLVLPWRDDVATASPMVKPIVYRGTRHMAVPHDLDHTRLLTNLGLATPSPMEYQYNWPGPTPFKVQKETAKMLVSNRRVFVLNDIGTGKTRAALFAADFLMMKGRVRKALIAAPLSTLGPVWEDEIFRIFTNRTCVVLHGTKKKRQKLLEEDVDFYIINHDGVEVIRPDLLQRDDIDLVVVDELAMYRNARAKRWKAINPIVLRAKYAWGMTGAPIPNGPVDAYGQVKLIAPSNVPISKRQFQQTTMQQVSTFVWVPRKTATAYVHNIMQPSVRYSRDECIDLPETMSVTRSVSMSRLQTKAFEMMFSKMQVSFIGGDITAANEAVKLMKLIQICNGFIYTKEGHVADLKATARQQALLEVIEETTHKVIVFVPFIHSIGAINDVVSKQYTTEVVYGDVSAGKRNKIFTSFQRSKDPRVLIAHPGCMSHGLTLTAASTIVWYSPLYSLDTYIQACGRITRPGQKNKQYIVHLVSHPLEEKMYKKLSKKESLQGVLLSMFNRSKI